MTERRDAIEEILEYLSGAVARPTFEDLDNAARVDAQRKLAILEDLRGVDVDAVATFEEDPVAVRLGFRDGPPETRVFGPAVRAARERAGMSATALATAGSRSGLTIDAGFIEALEEGQWQTIQTRLADALADACGSRLAELTLDSGFVDPVAVAAVNAHDRLLVTKYAGRIASEFPRRLEIGLFDLAILAIAGVTDEERSTALQIASDELIEVGYFDRIMVVADDDELTSWVLATDDVMSYFHAPDGHHREATSAPAILPLPFEMAMKQIVEQEVVEWVNFSGSLRPSLDADSDNLCDQASDDAYRAFLRSASRVADDRRDAFASVDESVKAAIAQLIRALLIEPESAFDPVAVLDDVS